MNGPSEFSTIGSLRDFEREADLARINVPVLYLSGEYDTCTPAASRAYAAATPHGEVAVIQGSGHLTTIDAPDATNQVVRAFLHRVES
jgi:proline iminopeptidase